MLELPNGATVVPEQCVAVLFPVFTLPLRLLSVILATGNKRTYATYSFAHPEAISVSRTRSVHVVATETLANASVKELVLAPIKPPDTAEGG